MPLLAVSRVPLRQVARQVAAPSRAAHTAEYKHTPFEYKNKSAFAFKVAAYCGAGFGLPFLAAYYQLKKASAA